MKRILTILLMTVAFAMNVSVVNAKISTGQGGTGKEFMMAMMADGDPKSTATINGDSKTWEYGTFQLYSWDSGANITFVLANGNCSYLINGDSEPGNTYKSNSFAGNADKEIIVTVTEMGVINNIYGQYRFVFEKDANQNYVCNYYGEYTGGGGSDDPTPTAPAAPTISCSNNTITIEAESGAGIKYIYSTDGNDPSGDFTTTTNNTVTISITSGQIVKVIASATKNNLESTQASGGPFNYVEPASAPAAPSISINHGFEVNAADGGGYTISNTLTFTESTSGANIYYTTDGTDPKIIGTRQTVSNNGQVVIGLDNNYSNVIKIRAVAELSGTYSDETTMDKAYTPELSTNGTTLSITQNDYSTYIFYHGNGETTWTCMKSGRSIDNYANIAPVSVVAATAEKLLSNIAVQNGGGTLPTSGDWDYGSWNTATSGNLQINSKQKLLRYTVSNTRGQNEPTASSGTGIDNSYTFNFPLSSLSSDGTYYLQILTGDYNSTPIGVYTWKVTKSGSSYTYEYLGKNEDTQPTAKPTITFDANAGKVTAMSADGVDASHIYYTTDGNDPTTSSNTWANAQSNGVTLSSNATIKVMAQADGKSASQVVSFTNSGLPTINCNDNAITYSNTEGYTLMYSTNGSHYDINEITSISQNTTIYLKATNSNGVTVLTNKECTVVPTEAPTITCSGNTINISAVSGAVIKYRYSTDGSTPSGEYSTSSGNTQAITVGAGQTVKVEAYATKYGVPSNTVTGGPYRYVPTAPTISEGVDGGHSGQGTSSPYIYLRITNYTTVKPTDAYHVEYSFDGGQTYNTLTQSDGYIYIPASNFDGQDADISVYAKTVYVNDNERFESAVVEKKLHKTVGLTVAYNSGKITITAATTGWDEIMFSTDGGHNWFIHNFNDGNSFDVYPTTQYAPSYDGESPLYVRARAFKNGTFDNEALYMYSDEACYIGKPTIQDLAYTQVNSGDNTGLFNYFEIHSIEGLKVRYTTDGTDPTNSPTAKEYNMPGRISDSGIYEAEYDQYLSSSLVIPDEGMTLKVVATDGKGHFSDVYTSKLYQKSDMPIFTDFGSYIELSVENLSEDHHNTIYYKIDSGNWPDAGSVTPPYFYKKDFTTIQASALWNEWTKLYSDMLIVEVTTPTPTLSYDEDANQVTISCEEGKDLMYSINGDKSFIKASGQSITLDVPQGGLSVQAYSTSTAENTPETNMTTIYTSNVSTGNYTYTNTDPSITVSANWEEDGWEDDGETPLSNIFTITAPGYEGGTIYYTTDGTDPTTSSSVYDPENKPQLVVGDDYALTSSYTIKVLAVADGKENLTFSQTFEKTANTAITIVEGTQGDDFAKVSINNDNGFVWKQIGTPTETHDELWHKNTANPQDNIAYGNELYARTIEDGKLISNLVVRPVNDERFKFGPYLQTVFPSSEGSLVFYEEGDDNDELWETEGALYQGIAQTGLTFVQIVKAEYSFDGGTTYTTAQVVKPEDGSNIFIIPAEELIGKSSLTVKVLLETGEEVTSTITNEKVTEPVVEVITNGGENHNETGLQVSRPEDANTTECYILLSNDGGETWFIPTNEDDYDSPYTLYYDEGDPEDDAGLHRFIPTSVVFGENVETPDWSQVQVRVNNYDGYLLSDPVGVTTGSEWTDWEPYGRGTWTDINDVDGLVYGYRNVETYNIFVHTNKNDTNKKQIKIENWNNGFVADYVSFDDGYGDLIVNWDVDDRTCSVDKMFTGVTDNTKSSDQSLNFWMIPVEDDLVDSFNSLPNGSYNPETDTYTFNFYYHHDDSKETPTVANSGDNLQLVAATLKMEGMWLGDMDEESDDSAVQNSYMPQLSQYKIGLVKIPKATDNTNNYLDFDESGVCRIVLDDNDGDGDYDEFDDFFNTTGNDDLISSTSHNWNTNSTSTEPQIEDSELHKMLDQFTITDEGAYYIVVARQVPSLDENRNKIYEYTGAYQYMPVYYSPASNWKEVGNGECTYQDDIVGGLYDGYGSEPTKYNVIVEENVHTPGLYRVKNMYGSGFKENEDEENDRYSYQGESPYRENVYFYIDATEPNSVKLYNDMFYAQPLGVDWGCGEMMLVDLGTGKLTEDNINGEIRIKFNDDGEQTGSIYEWEIWYDCGYEYDGTDDFGCSDANDDENASNRFDLIIPVSTPSKTQPDAPTITYTEGSGKVTISTDEEGTTDYPVYLIYTINGDEPVLDQDYTVENGVPTASDANTVVVTGNSTSFYITSTKTVNAKVYCGKYTTPASNNATESYTIEAPAVQPKVTLINDYFKKSETSGIPDDNNYFMIKFDNNNTINTYSIVYEFTQDGNTLYYKDGASYSSYEGTITKDTPKPSVTTRIEGSTTYASTYNATFNPLECYISNGSSYVQAYPFDDEHPLIIKMRVKQGDSFIDGVAYSTPYTQSTAVVPDANYNEDDAQMEVTFDAEPSGGYSSTNPLTFYYRYSKKSSDVWSDRIVADEATDFTDKITYTTPSSMPGYVYTVSSQTDHLKVAYKYNITKYAKPDKPGISYDDTTPGTTHVTISTVEVGGADTPDTSDDYPVYLFYTTNGNIPVINTSDHNNPTAGTDTKMITSYTGTFDLTIDNTNEDYRGSKNVKAVVYCPNDDKYTTYESDDSIKYCPVWRDWQTYGTATWSDELIHNKMFSNYNFIDPERNLYTIYVRTDISNANYKQIKIPAWSDPHDGKSYADIYNTYIPTVHKKSSNDLILNWNLSNDSISLKRDFNTGLVIYSGDKEEYLWLLTNNITDNGVYIPDFDFYTVSFYYGYGSISESTRRTSNTFKLTLKMESLWLGDMTEEGNTATQEAFMPQNSHYKIGLVKIDGKELAEDDKYYIELEDASAVETFFDTNANTNFVDGTVKERHLNDGYNYTPLETGNENETVMKMKEEFDFGADDEGAYYIAVARMVPNGDGTYSYTGAYRYMPVYFSPAENWKPITYGGKRTFNDNIAFDYYQWALNSTWINNNEWIEDLDDAEYSVIVEENTKTKGLFRVKNLYNSNLIEKIEEEGGKSLNVKSYQGESPYRNVYFYIDARKEIDGKDQIIEDEETGEKYYPAKLYPSEFYAQPLGVDWENGELMLIDLEDGEYTDGKIQYTGSGHTYETDDIRTNFHLPNKHYYTYGNIINVNTLKEKDLYGEMFENNYEINWQDNTSLQISTPYPLFDDTPYTTTDMNEKWPDEYEENSVDYNEKYGELAIFDEESDCYTQGITEGQDHVDVTYERDLTNTKNSWGTIMLPCPLKAGDLKLEVNGEIYVDEEAEEDANAFNLYHISGFSDDKKQVKFTKIDDDVVIAPNTPIVFKSNTDILTLAEDEDVESIKLVIDNMDTKVDAIGTATDDNTSYSDTEDGNGLYIYDDKLSWLTIANYTPVAFTIDDYREDAIEMGYNPETQYDLAQSYFINSDEILQATAGIRNLQYRAFFYKTNSVGGNAKSYSVVFEDKDPIFTDIDSVVDGRSKRAGSYNVAGQKVNRNYRGVVIENGKKSIRIKR